jgi:AAA+ ATPase superfamily predicted ATPase
MRSFIGREAETQRLTEILEADEPAFIAVYGRRRVGKTYFLKQKLAPWLVFEMSGMYKGTLQQHLAEFAEKLAAAKKLSLPIAPPASWLDAFKLLITALEEMPRKKKKAIFLDELPWLNTPKSGFLTALEYFWNSWASMRPDVTLVVCGSAASWMIKHIIRNKGGLHNRITHQIKIQPFSLYETEDFISQTGSRMDRYQMLQLYMAFGGIPHYLKEVKAGKSATQIIDEVCFSPQGLLKDEFVPLYESLFSNASVHMQVIRTLAKKLKGMSRSELIAATGLPNAGSTTRVLEELEQSDFIMKMYPFGKLKRDALYRVTDLFSIFYMRFMESGKTSGKGAWQTASQTPAVRTWSGYGFESLAMLHLHQIKEALGIAGVYTEAASWQHKEPGAQIDLLIDRADHVINICELKYASLPYTITKTEAEKSTNRMQIFQKVTNTKKTVWPVLVTPFGCDNTDKWPGLYPSVITMDDLFRPK